MTDQARLESLLGAAHSCVWIVTDEEEHALRMVREAAMGLKLGVRQWDVINGIRGGLVAGSAAEAGSEHPVAALYRFTQEREPVVMVMLDLIAHLGDDRTLRALRELIARLDLATEAGQEAGRLVLIDHRDSLPPVLRAGAVRFEISPPDETEIEALVVATLRTVHRQRPIELDMSKKDLAAVVRNLHGLGRRQVEQTIVTAVWEDRKFSGEDLAGILARKRQVIQSDGLLEFVQAPTSMSEVGGLAGLKSWLKQREDALSDEAVRFGIKPPRGLLMLGVQGAGKSLCAKAIATAWKRPLMRLDPSVLYDRYIGESERKLRDALRQAEVMAPVVLWIDEIEKAFASAAAHSIDGGLSQRMFGTFLTWMQEHREPVFLAATSNDVQALPPELLRKGRFDEIFFVDLPGAAARKEILRIHLTKRGRDPKQFDLPALAAASEGYSGAEIEQGILSALHEAFSAKADLTTDRMMKALKSSPPLSVTMAERIQDLREWAKGRCVPAE